MHTGNALGGSRRAKPFTIGPMQLTADAKLPFPRPVVFAGYRDRLRDLLKFLPNVRDIEIKSRKEEGKIVKLLNVWHGGGEIPAAARAIVSEAMLSWDDHASWNEEDFTCAWIIHPHAFTDAIRCEGQNRFIEDGGATVLQMRGVIEIDGKKIKGVPGFLAGKVGKTVEDFLAAKIQPNLVEVSAGLGKYLAERNGVL